uniref:5'-methylthioadenosine/adenosylhomocysteine nucleosidase n=1 Tax=Cohnella sp. REN36 TaxID=2887347 RepID=UPI001D1582D4
MRVAFIAPMSEEAAPLLGRFDHASETTVAGASFYAGELAGRETLLLRCGIGKTNAAWTTAVLIERYRPDLILHYGVAGGLAAGLRVGDVVLATELAYSDVDATAFGYEYGQVPQMPSRYPVEPGLLALAERAASSAGTEGRLARGLITTADAFVNRPEQAAAIRAHFPEVQAIDMEGAAIAQTASRFGVSCLVVRALSDLAGVEGRDVRHQRRPGLRARRRRRRSDRAGLAPRSRRDRSRLTAASAPIKENGGRRGNPWAAISIVGRAACLRRCSWSILLQLAGIACLQRYSWSILLQLRGGESNGNVHRLPITTSATPCRINLFPIPAHETLVAPLRYNLFPIPANETPAI